MFLYFLIIIFFALSINTVLCNLTKNQLSESGVHIFELKNDQQKYFHMNFQEIQEKTQNKNLLNIKQFQFLNLNNNKVCQQYFSQFCRQQKNSQTIQCFCFSKQKQKAENNFFLIQSNRYLKFISLCFNLKNFHSSSTINTNIKAEGHSIIKIKQKQFKNNFVEPILNRNKDSKKHIQKLINKKQMDLNDQVDLHTSSLFFRILQENNQQQSDSSDQKYKCNSRCRTCDQNHNCLVCKTGYQKTENQTCRPNFYLRILSIIMSFSFKIYNYPLLYEIFFNEFSFYEHHNIKSPQIYLIFQFIGSINRERFISLCIQNIIPNTYLTYRKWQYQLALSQNVNLTGQTFLNIYKTQVYFISNIIDIIVWYFIIVVPFIILTNILNFIYQKLTKQVSLFLLKCSSIQFLLMAVFQSPSQYIIFMFCKQIINASYLYFTHKLNYTFCIIFTFPFIFLSLTGYSLYSHFSTKQKLQLLYPFDRHYTFKAMLINTINGSGKWVLIGIIQSSINMCDIKMVLLLLINIMMTVSLKYYISNAKNKFINQNLFIFLIMKFCLFGVFSHLNIGKNLQIHHKIQYVSLTAMIVLCAIQLIYHFFGYFVIFINLVFDKLLIKQQASKQRKNVKRKMRTVSGFQYYN